MKNIYKITFLFLPIAFCQLTIAFSQVTFQRFFGKSNTDQGLSVCQTADGGYIVSGTTYGTSLNDNDVYLIKFDANGNVIWNRILGDSGDNTGYSVFQTLDGGYIITGHSGSGVGNYDVYLIKTDDNGNVTWTKTFGGTSSEEGYSVQQTADGGYFVTGRTSAAATNFYLIKTNSNGDTLWTKSYGGAGSTDFGNFGQQTSDGGYAIIGYTAGDVCLIKTDNNGNLMWTKKYGGANSDNGYHIYQTTDGGYIITGLTNSFGAGNDDVYLIKTDSIGTTLWTRTFGGAADDFGNSVQQTTDGGYIITGTTQSFGMGNTDVYLIKTDANGDSLWTKTFGGSSYEYGLSVKQATDGGYIITGRTYSFGASGYDVYLIKTDSLGNSGCNQSSPATIVTIPATQETSPANTISSQTTLVNSPATVVGTGGFANTLCLTVGIIPIESAANDDRIIITPNPFTTHSKLTFKNPGKEKFLFTLYDITGRVTESVSTTNNEIILTKGGKPAGVYLFNLVNEKTGERMNGKIIVSN